MIEKYINGDISRKDLEHWILTHSLENEYAKPYSGQPFKINAQSQYQVIDLPVNPEIENKPINIPPNETNR